WSGLVLCCEQRLGLGPKRLQLLDMLGRKAVLALGPLDGPVEAVLGLVRGAELGVTHGEEEQVEGGEVALLGQLGAVESEGGRAAVLFGVFQAKALLQRVDGRSVPAQAILHDAERVLE